MDDKNTNKKSRVKNIAATVIVIVLAVLLIPILVVNLTLIIKGNVNKDVPPDIFGVAPLAVTTGSMSGENKDSFDEGALIYIRVLDEEDKNSLKTGDVICFKTEGVFVTHRIISVTADESGNLVSVVTKGDANTASDPETLAQDIFGIYSGSAAGLGGFALFLQTPVGILVFVGVPVVLFIIYDVVRITLYNKRIKAQSTAKDAEGELQEKDEEIERLRAIIKEQENAKNQTQEEAEQDPPEEPAQETQSDED